MRCTPSGRHLPQPRCWLIMVARRDEMERANRLGRRVGASLVVALGLLLCACTGARQPATIPPSPALGSRQGAAQQAVASGTVTIDASAPGATISSQVRGANMALWFDITQAGIAKEFQTAKLQLTRWPGGSDSDLYHWQTQT